MATEAILSVTEIGKLLVEPVRRQVDYFRNYEKHVKTLTKEMVKRKEEMVKLNHAVKEADREGKIFVGDVDGLVNEANELIKNAEAFLRNNENEDSGNNKCKVIFCSVWIKQYQHGRKANKMSKKVADLVNRKTEKFGDGSMTYSGPDRGAIEPLKGFEEFQSRKQIFKDMMAALRSPGVTKIGAYGMNGVGKTTLVRAIASQACKEQLVDEVAMATVFQAQNIIKEGGEEAVTPDIKRIQDEITDCFKFKLQNTTVSRKADELQKRLKDEKKIKRLIILDDVWVGVKLEDIGIPDDHDGCKILMTSTDEHVLSREMGSKNFQLNPLQLPEAHEWFKKMVGDVVKNPEIDRVADNIVEKCDCLPILLVHVTNGLKYVENLDAWDSALDQLSNYDKDGSHRLVDVGLRLSINQLQEDAKQLFLLCGQFAPDGISINYLLRYSIAMGLFGNKCHTLAVSRTRLLGLVSQLKACSLLQEGRDREILMMHNIVHSFVMSFQAKNALMISENDLPPWPGIDLEICIAISLYCKISDLPEELKCPNLNFFLLSNDNSPLQFPKHFFRAMGKLKVLNFTGLDFSSSLPSFEFLTNLQTLCLDECKLNGVTNMGIISQLKNLKILSFRGSNIVRLPIEIKQLSHLQLLDLNECLKLKEIPQTLLSDLKRLEDLYMEYVCLNWEVEGTKNRLTELAPLTNLSSLCIHIADPMILTMDLFSEKLERFKILIGGHWDWFDRHDSSKTLKLKLNGNVLSMKRIRVLMKKVEELYLQELDAGKTSVREIDGFPRLKHLHMKMVHKIEYINSLERDSISFDKMTLSKGSSAAFTMLESLYLENLKDLKKISHGKFIAKSFGNLRILEVTNCPALKYLFSTSMANALPLLEEFEISDCETLEAMAIEESEDDTGRVQNINLPQLQKLKLESLPNFASFW